MLRPCCLTFRLIYRPISLIYFLPFCQFIKCCSRLVVQQPGCSAGSTWVYWNISWSVLAVLQQTELRFIPRNCLIPTNVSTQNCSQLKCRLLTDNFSSSPSSEAAMSGLSINHVENITNQLVDHQHQQTYSYSYIIYQNPKSILSLVVCLVARVLIIQHRI